MTMDPARDPKTFVSRFELDYFQRSRKLRRWKWMLSFAALLVSGVAVAAMMVIPRFHAAFQSAPVSHSHSGFGDNCTACHDQPFGVAVSRFFPGSKVGTVSDAKCLACHDAGRHTLHQLYNTGLGGKSSGCIDCHKEHRGDTLSRLSDIACTNCHGDLKTDDNAKRFYDRIHHFTDGHPAFGAWRKTAIIDPAGGKFFFNHERHLELANELKDIPKETRPFLIAEAERLRQQDCAYCHKSDPDMKRMLPIRYDDHCAACHPLNVQAVPAAHWPNDVAANFAKTPLSHPGPGESSAKIRAEILDRYVELAGRAKPATAGTTTEPPILRTNEDAKEIQEKERIAMEHTRQTETQLFDRAGASCALCHKEKDRRDGLPRYEFPYQQRGRWKDEIVYWPVERMRAAVYADAANRWYPLATFDHGVHRIYACTECHAARTSNKTEDVLIPKIDNCLVCHNRSSTSAHANCLTCHHYHDRSQERSARPETPDALRSLMQRVKP
jgi:hypothetical protein